MATYIKDLVEDNGDITRPVTEAGAVLLSGGGDLETELTKYVTAEDIATTSALTPPVQTNMIADDAVTAAKIAGGDALSTLANGALVEIVGTTTGNYNFAWKYADGRLICFQQYSWTGKNTTSYGQLHAVRVMTPKNYAVQFTALPAITVNLIASTGQWNGWLCTAFEGSAGTTSKPTEYQFIRPTSGTNTNGTFCLVAYGFWK